MRGKRDDVKLMTFLRNGQNCFPQVNAVTKFVTRGRRKGAKTGKGFIAGLCAASMTRTLFGEIGGKTLPLRVKLTTDTADITRDLVLT